MEVENFQIRTDLALESQERIRKNNINNKRKG